MLEGRPTESDNCSDDDVIFVGGETNKPDELPVEKEAPDSSPDSSPDGPDEGVGSSPDPEGAAAGSPSESR